MMKIAKELQEWLGDLFFVAVEMQEHLPKVFEGLKLAWTFKTRLVS